MKHIDKMFKEKLYNHEAVVPEGIWEKIAPIAEEESGKAILWFWLAGLLALLLGGIGLYKVINTTSTDPTVPGTLVYQQEMDDLSNDISVDNSLMNKSNILEEKYSAVEELEVSTTDNLLKINQETSPINKKKPSKLQKNTNSLLGNNQISTENNPSQSIDNSVESITNIVGVPANLVITKSYINKEGSVIKQTNLTDDSPVYDVIINSEAKDFNAGALLRIIEPLENIPLPAFQKKLKKKTTNSIR